jgi:hypothetical protein
MAKIVSVREVDGTKHDIELEARATVDTLVQRLADKLNISRTRVRLICRGNVLNNEPTLLISAIRILPSEHLICNVLAEQARPAEEDLDEESRFRLNVNRLVEMGFGQADSEMTLRAQKGNVEAAVGFLMHVSQSHRP